MSGQRRPQQFDDQDFSHQDHDSQQKSRYLRNLIWLVPVLFAVFLLIMGSLYIHTNLGSEHIHAARNVLFRAAANLKELPIVDIETKAPTETCSADFKELSFGSFGAVQGDCLCRNGSVHSKAYCALHAFSSECGIVKSLKATDVKIYNSFKLCVKRNTDFKHSRDPCSANYENTKCFTHYCIQTGEKCGYNFKASGSDAGTPQLLEEVEEESNRILSINHNHITHDPVTDTATPKLIANQVPYTAQDIKIQYQVADVGMPFIGFEVITGDKPCWNNRLREEKQSKKSYPLLEIKETGCGEFNTFDDIVDIIKNKLKYKTFIQKLIPSPESALNNEKFWDSYYTDTDYLSLVAVRRIIINSNDNLCYNVNPDSIRKLDDQIETLKSTLNGIFIAVVVVVSLMILIAIIFYVLKDKTFFHFDFRTRSSSKVLTILGIIASILVITGGIIYYTRETNVQKYQTEFQTYIDKKCFDSYKTSLVKAFQTIVNFANDQHGDLANIAKASFFAGISFIVITVVLLVLKQKTGTPLFEGPFRED